jgi:hypothetical protein
MPRITIKREFGQRNVFQGEALIATIHDHRHNPERRAAGTQVRDNWNVCWRNGRVDWHETYGEARDNALKGQ